MPKLAILDIYHGDFSQSFEIALEIKGNGQSLRKVQGKLPPAEEIPKLYQDWRNSYLQLETALRGKLNEATPVIAPLIWKNHDNRLRY